MKQSIKTADLVDHVRWYIKLRWLYIICLGVAWLGSNIILQGVNQQIIDDIELLLMGVLLNLIFYLAAKRRVKNIQYYYRIAVALLVADILTASIVLFNHGGVEARTIILYGIPVFIAGALFGRRMLIFTILAASVAYDFTILFHAAVHGHFIAWLPNCITLIIFYDTVFLMVGLVAKRSLDKTTEYLKLQNRELMAFNKAKDEFISIASHQLRTPATAVKQYIGMMAGGYGGSMSAKQQTMLERAYESNERQLKIVSDLLQVAKIDAGRLKPTKRKSDLSKLLQEVVQEQLPEFSRRKQTVSLEVPSTPTNATVDVQLIRMAVENIVNNASKFSHQGQTIKVTLQPHNGVVNIVIADQGIGIHEDDQKKLFQKFTRLNGAMSGVVDGSGLGLYWAKKIIDLHGGDIKLDSQHKKGSTFTITLPTKSTTGKHIPATAAAS